MAEKRQTRSTMPVNLARIQERHSPATHPGCVDAVRYPALRETSFPQRYVFHNLLKPLRDFIQRIILPESQAGIGFRHFCTSNKTSRANARPSRRSTRRSNTNTRCAFTTSFGSAPRGLRKTCPSRRPPALATTATGRSDVRRVEGREQPRPSVRLNIPRNRTPPHKTELRGWRCGVVRENERELKSEEELTNRVAWGTLAKSETAAPRKTLSNKEHGVLAHSSPQGGAPRRATFSRDGRLPRNKSWEDGAAEPKMERES